MPTKQKRSAPTNEELIARVRDESVCTDALHRDLADALESALAGNERALVAATQEALSRYPENHVVDDPEGETGYAETDPYGYDETARAAFVQGALFEAKRADVLAPKTQDAKATEYGYNTGSTTTWIGGREQIEAWAATRGMGVGVGDWGSRIMCRRPAGPWVPVSLEGGE